MANGVDDVDRRLLALLGADPRAPMPPETGMRMTTRTVTSPEVRACSFASCDVIWLKAG